jgi:septum site-determining protein MinC
MHRIRRLKRLKSAAAKPARPAVRSRKPKALAPRALRALSKTELVALALDLQRRVDGPAPAPAAADVPPARAASLVIATSVRSGQSIEFPDGDVTVIGSVGSGAEIVAGGSVHIYGTLRGRAIAGVNGDSSARVFCQNLQAELISIDGHYRVAENFDPRLRGRPMQAYLDGMKMVLAPLDGEAPLDGMGDSRLRALGGWGAAARVKSLIGLSTRRDPAGAEPALR